MAKIIKKSQLTFVDGMFAKGDDVIFVEPAIILQANMLETLAQKTAYLAAQPDYSPVPSLDEFEREYVADQRLTSFVAQTPTLDAKAEEALRIMDELDDATTANQANSMLENYRDLYEFCSVDYVVGDTNRVNANKFDMPILGNPLKLTTDDIENVIAAACGMEVE